MKLLLDTHILIWLFRSPDRLNTTERALLARQDARKLVSAVSIWELRIKWYSRSDRARQELIEPNAVLALAGHQGLEPVALAPSDCVETLNSPLQHRDPFDEQLLIHAKQLGAKLLTRDRLLIGHPLAYQPPSGP